MAFDLYRTGSVDDIRTSLSHIATTSPLSLRKEIEKEVVHKNRLTVIRMIAKKMYKMAKLPQYQSKGAVLKIHFNDHGQDFLWWEVDQAGSVVDCGPFQASVWCGNVVLCAENLKASSTVFIVTKQGEVLELNYQVEKVEDLTEKEASNG